MTLSKQISYNSEIQFHISPRRIKEILRIEKQMDNFLSKKHKWRIKDEI